METLKLTDFHTDGTKYLTFSNQDGKQWSIPMQNSRVALEIYEPSGIKGRMLKKFFVPISKIGLIKIMLKGRYTNVHLSTKLRKLLQKCFGMDFEYSIFWGTPCIDQKITIQIYKDKRILGYCKIGHSERVKELFFHEKKVLDLLEEKEIRHVAKCLLLEPISEQDWVFVQSTEKQCGMMVEHCYGEQHEIFLKNLWLKTKHNILFENTDYYRSLLFLEQHLSLIRKDYQKSVERALNCVKKYYKNKVVEWGVVHRDFTPWNTCVTKEGVFVFDFEYALLQAPKEFDYWHFFVQTNFFVRKNDMMKIAEKYIALSLKEEEHFLFINYLLDIISVYLGRGEKQDIDVANDRAMLLANVLHY